jgi:hypothetical protein
MPFGRKKDNDATDVGVSASYTVTYKGGLRHLPKAKLGKITLDILKIDSASRQGTTWRASSGPTSIWQSLSVLDAMVLASRACSRRAADHPADAREACMKARRLVAAVTVLNPTLGRRHITNLVASRAQAGRPVIARDGPAQHATRECSAVY